MVDERGIDTPTLALSAKGDGRFYEISRETTDRYHFAFVGQILYRDRLKRCLDIVGAGFLLLALAPLMLLISVIVLASDGGPVLFVQERIGRNGRRFRLYKFRSMVPDAEAVLSRWKHEHPDIFASYHRNNFKLSRDPRLLPCGGLLRRFSLDELPQLLNVLKGDMSLVGPRPLLHGEIVHYQSDFNLYKSVRPGVTGLWQVSGRSSTSFSDRARLDAIYVQNVTFLGDCRLLVRTLPCVLTGRGAY